MTAQNGRCPLNSSPLQLKPNYAWRSYLGGSHLRSFRNESAGEDNHFPEDWLASTARARNGDNQQRDDEGVSHLIVDGNDVALTDLIASNPDWFWGQQVPPKVSALKTLKESTLISKEILAFIPTPKPAAKVPSR